MFEGNIEFVHFIIFLFNFTSYIIHLCWSSFPNSCLVSFPKNIGSFYISCFLSTSRPPFSLVFIVVKLTFSMSMFKDIVTISLIMFPSCFFLPPLVCPGTMWNIVIVCFSMSIIVSYRIIYIYRERERALSILHSFQTHPPANLD